MNAHMFCQCLLLCERLSALIACERLFSSVHPHVALQTIGFSDIGYICAASPLYASSSCGLSSYRNHCWKTRTLCICKASPQSGSFCAALG